MTQKKNKNVLIAGFPKSGNTWLGFMLSYILNACYSEEGLVDQLPTQQKSLLPYLQGQNNHTSEFDFVVKTHRSYSFYDKNLKLETYDAVIYIVRDPRDVITSFYYYKYYNIPAGTGKTDRYLAKSGPLLRYLKWKKNLITEVKNWADHILSWSAVDFRIDVRYEDISLNVVSFLKGLLDRIGINVEQELIKKAADIFSFKNMSGGRNPGDEQVTSFFRKGVVGDYRNHFGPLDHFIMRKYAKEGMARYGYK